MQKPPDSGHSIDWSLATWEGSRREELRRWAALPLDCVIAALEEMQELTEALRASPETKGPEDSTGSAGGSSRGALPGPAAKAPQKTRR